VTGYGAAPAPDPFAASRTAFEALASALAGNPAAALTHDALEELVDRQGLALLRQLLQDHYDLRANREEQALHTPARSRVTGPDGGVRPWREVGRARQLVGLFGRVTVSRVAWRGARTSRLRRPLPPELTGSAVRALRALPGHTAAKSAADQRKP
jgi:hypothetical protein